MTLAAPELLSSGASLLPSVPFSLLSSFSSGESQRAWRGPLILLRTLTIALTLTQTVPWYVFSSLPRPFDDGCQTAALAPTPTENNPPATSSLVSNPLALRFHCVLVYLRFRLSSYPLVPTLPSTPTPLRPLPPHPTPPFPHPPTPIPLHTSTPFPPHSPPNSTPPPTPASSCS